MKQVRTGRVSHWRCDIPGFKIVPRGSEDLRTAEMPVILALQQSGNGGGHSQALP